MPPDPAYRAQRQMRRRTMAFRPVSVTRLALRMLSAVCVGIGLAASAGAQSAAALQARHASLAAALEASPFQRPLVLEANDSAHRPHGEVHAVVDQPFTAISATLRQPAHWCDVLMLQMNVKRCAIQGGMQEPVLQVVIGRKADQPIEDAFVFGFRFTQHAVTSDYLSVHMSADEGPLGTRDYRLVMEAVPLDARRSFVRLSYAYANGLSARMATRAYLATSGRDKVGFTVLGRDAQGQPRYVEGMQGIAERNAMRYFLAIEAFLDAIAAPPDQRADLRLQRWFAATERHARQLHEMEREDYLAMKRRQLRASGPIAEPPTRAPS